MTPEEFAQLKTDLKARSAQLDSVSERLEIIEDFLATHWVSLKNSKIKKIYRSRTFGQFGEDMWIRGNIKLPEKGYFIEVGAADGITNSNTYWLEKMGWDGVCFEPDPRNYMTAKLYRNNVLPMAIGNKNGTAIFSLASVSPDWSGLDIPVAADKTIDVKTMTLDTYLSNANIPHVDFISIDVEGSELAVLEGFSLDHFQPSVVVLEYLSPTKDISNELREYMTKRNYKEVWKTFSNLIFVPV